MLTGDKLETAIEIAKSCKVVQENMSIVQVTTNSKKEVSQILKDILVRADLDEDVEITDLKHIRQMQQVIAIDGSTLALTINDEELVNLFYRASLVSKSIVCCRVSPKQKADIV